MHKEYMLSCFNLNKMEDEEDFFESIDEMKSYIEQGGELSLIHILTLERKDTKFAEKPKILPLAAIFILGVILFVMKNAS